MEHEHHEKIILETVEENSEFPKKTENASPAFLAGTVILGAILISASIFYNTGVIVKKLDGLQASVGQFKQQEQGNAGATGDVSVSPRDNQPVLGNLSAKVTIVEFGDFQCPYCKNFFQSSFPQIKAKYIDTGKVKYVFRHFPLTQIHINAQISAVAAECANQQGKFWEYHDVLYTKGQSDGGALDKASLEKYAGQLGLNNGTLGFGKNKFNQCLESNSTLAIVQADQAEGVKDGITGTPSFFINGKSIVGAQPFSQFQQVIDAALAK